jgi:peptidoglycan/xylan/chitin deacetylase (PgdA/CDA1 family)
VAAEGHEVALHGADHRSLVHVSRRAVRARLESAASELAAIAGAPVKLFRPPFGAQTVRSYLGARDVGLDCVVWDLDSFDWLGGNEQEVADSVITQATEGAIVLAHDGRAGIDEQCALDPPFDRAGMAELLIGGLARRGLHNITVSDLLAVGNVHRTVWFSHYITPRARQVAPRCGCGRPLSSAYREGGRDDGLAGIGTEHRAGRRHRDP